MNVFVQGMRRSGTTILFDILSEDGRLDCYYEPLAAGDKFTLGGGSGARQVDYFDKIRACRVCFLREYGRLDDVNLLNHGAPRQAELEFETTVPDHIWAYLRYMTEQAPDTAIKFTRMYCKVPVLRALDPTAKFIHIVRDPRSVVASYLFGKNQKNRPKYDTPEAFFGRSTNRLSWSCGRFSDLLLARPENAHLREIPDFMRIMLVWKFTFERAWADGRTAFGPNYRLLRHEDLANDPVGTVESLYAFLEKPVSPTALAWATANLRPAGELFAPEHAAWQRAIDALDLQPLLTAAGYHGQVDHSDRLITHAA